MTITGTAPEIAYAKINLALHVRSRREDGYHEIETLFGFVDAGDVLTANVSDEDRLSTCGEFASELGSPFDNLAARALGMLPRAGGIALTLEKNLPVAAGLGGGSADAGAVFRLIERLYGLPEDWRARASRLGADVPACVRSETAIGQGTGTALEPVENDLKGMAVLLVNPRIPLATGNVFGKWDGLDRGPLPMGKASEIARKGRNDLEIAAIALVPQIGDVLRLLAQTKPVLARMSGSGASCFALYETGEKRDVAACRIAADHPEWWQLSGLLR